MLIAILARYRGIWNYMGHLLGAYTQPDLGQSLRGMNRRIVRHIINGSVLSFEPSKMRSGHLQRTYDVEAYAWWVERVCEREHSTRSPRRRHALGCRGRIPRYIRRLLLRLHLGRALSTASGRYSTSLMLHTLTLSSRHRRLVPMPCRLPLISLSPALIPMVDQRPL